MSRLVAGARSAALLVAAAFCLPACSTFDPAKWAAAANEHDKDCYAHKKYDVVPVLVFGYPFPLISAHYEAICNADKAPKTPVAADSLQVGALVQ